MFLNTIRKRPIIFGVTFVAGVLCVFALLIGVYASRIRRSAAELVESAKRIHSASDAEREMSLWHGRLPQTYWKSSDGNLFRVELRNGLLSVLHLVPSTGMTFQVTTRQGELQTVTMGMYNDESSVWVQEDFETGSGQLQVSSEKGPSGKDAKAVIMFNHNDSRVSRSMVFALDPSCMTRPGGCDSSSQMLPSINQLRDLASAASKGSAGRTSRL